MPNFLTDSFTDANGTAVTSHVGETGHTWVRSAFANNAQVPQIQGNDVLNEVSGQSGSSVFQASVVAPAANYAASMTFLYSSGPATFVGARLSSSGGYFWGYEPSAARLALYAAPSFTIIGQRGIASLTPGEIYTLEIDIVGTTINGRLQRQSDGKWLKYDGIWYATKEDNVIAGDSTTTAAGAVGFWLLTNSTTDRLQSIRGDTAGGSVGNVTDAVIATNGQDIALTLSASSVLGVSDVTVRVGDLPVYPTSVAGSGTAWTVTRGRRWILPTQNVSVKVGTATVAATNSSVINSRSTWLAGLPWGLFIHFGLETFTDQEWSDGAAAASVFAPTGTVEDAVNQWAATALLAGMEYACLTAKHHCGYCLWPTATTTYSVAGTSWETCLLRYVRTMRAAGLRVGIYWSPWDRRFERDNPGYTPAAYQAYLQAQLTELLTQFGPIDFLWYDGWNWPTSQGVPLSVVSYASIVTFARSLQPNIAIIVNNDRHQLTGIGGDNGSDLVSYEAATVGAQIPSNNRYPAEEHDTIRGDAKWFWKTAADAPKAAATLIADRTRINSRGGTYHLNCGPDRSGKIEDALVRILAEVGSASTERSHGISVWNGTGALRTVTLTLTTDGTTPAANVSGLRYAFYDTPNPSRHERPVGQGITATNGSGVLSVVVFCTLAPGGIGWLTVTNSDGTIPAGTGASGFSGPVAVS